MPEQNQPNQPEAAPKDLSPGSSNQTIIPGEIKENIDPEEPTTLHERTMAALSYIGFLAIIPFYLQKNSKFCRFHGKQGLVLAIIFFFFKLFTVIDLLHDLSMALQFGIFLYMGLAALSGQWKKCRWVYEAAVKLEKQLSLETDDEEAMPVGKVETSNKQSAVSNKLN